MTSYNPSQIDRSTLAKHSDLHTVSTSDRIADCHRRAAARWTIRLLIFSAVLGGCQSSPTEPESKGATQQSGLKEAIGINPLKLKSELVSFMDASLAESIAAYTDIASEYRERRIREHCLRFKMRRLDFYLTLSTVEDPREVFILNWTAFVNIRQFVTEGSGKENLGQAQARMEALSRKFEADIIALGYRHFSKEIIDAAKDDIEEAALEFSWDSPLASDAVLQEARDDTDLVRILLLPLKPISSLGNIGKLGNTPEAIDRFTDTANDFSLVIRYLPERFRWQMQMLLLEMESSGPAAAMIKQTQSVQQSVQDLIALFETMPANMRNEFEKSIEATEKSLPEFRSTLKEARVLAETTHAMVEDVNRTTLQAEKMAIQFTETAEAFEVAAAEIRGLIADVREWRNPGEPNGPSLSDSPERDSGVSSPQGQKDYLAPKQGDSEGQRRGGSVAKDYEQTAESIKAAAQEVRTLVSELQEPVNEEGSLRQVAGEFRALIKSVFWHAVALVGIIFTLALAYRFATYRLATKRK